MRRTSRGLRGQSSREEASGFTDPSHEVRDQEEVELLSLPSRGPTRWTQPGLWSGGETVPTTGVFGLWLVFGLWTWSLVFGVWWTRTDAKSTNPSCPEGIGKGGTSKEETWPT